MERENLWVNNSIVLEQNSVKMKRIEVPIKEAAQTVAENMLKNWKNPEYVQGTTVSFSALC